MGWAGGVGGEEVQCAFRNIYTVHTNEGSKSRVRSCNIGRGSPPHHDSALRSCRPIAKFHARTLPSPPRITCTHGTTYNPPRGSMCNHQSLFLPLLHPQRPKKNPAHAVPAGRTALSINRLPSLEPALKVLGRRCYFPIRGGDSTVFYVRRGSLHIAWGLCYIRYSDERRRGIGRGWGRYCNVSSTIRGGRTCRFVYRV